MKQIKYSTHAQYLKALKRKKAGILCAQISLLLLFFLTWELLTYFEIVDDFITSSPSRMIRKLIELVTVGDLWTHTLTTLIECVLGFLISMVLGVTIAVLLWWSETARKILDPYIVVLNSLPKIALGPIIIIWVGAGMQAIVMMTILIALIITIISSLNGFLSCDENKILLLKSMGATKLQILTKLILPFSVPNLIGVLKINVGLSWVGTIMGEYLVSSAGLGWLILYGGTVFQFDLVMASIFVLCVIAGLMYGVVSLIEKLALKAR